MNRELPRIELTRFYRKKPVVVEAIQWRANKMLLGDVLDFFDGLSGANANAIGRKQGNLIIRTLEGEMTVSDGDWIIKGVKGEFYPCKPDVFEQTYEPVVNDDFGPSKSSMGLMLKHD